MADELDFLSPEPLAGGATWTARFLRSDPRRCSTDLRVRISRADRSTEDVEVGVPDPPDDEPDLRGWCRRWIGLRLGAAGRG